MMMGGFAVILVLFFYIAFIAIGIFVTYLIIKLAVKNALKELIRDKVPLEVITTQLADNGQQNQE